MAAPKDLKPKVPGAPAEAEQTEQSVEQGEQGEQGAAQPGPVESQQGPTEAEPTIEELKARIAQLEGAPAAPVPDAVVERTFAAEVAEDPNALAEENARLKEELARYRKANAEDSALPDQRDVDPSTIKRAVLTRQGWVVPLPPPEPQQRRGYW